MPIDEFIGSWSVQHERQLAGIVCASAHKYFRIDKDSFIWNVVAVGGNWLYAGTLSCLTEIPAGGSQISYTSAFSLRRLFAAVIREGVPIKKILDDLEGHLPPHQLALFPLAKGRTGEAIALGEKLENDNGLYALQVGGRRIVVFNVMSQIIQSYVAETSSGRHIMIYPNSTPN